MTAAAAFFSEALKPFSDDLEVLEGGVELSEEGDDERLKGMMSSDEPDVERSRQGAVVGLNLKNVDSSLYSCRLVPASKKLVCKNLTGLTANSPLKLRSLEMRSLEVQLCSTEKALGTRGIDLVGQGTRLQKFDWINGELTIEAAISQNEIS